ncbi:MAG: flippase-like domain-containing protein [Verrucomicrobia bacterium]|nr:flippase-like domain-containing protein [Verrucomicrobiota bacterium]
MKNVQVIVYGLGLAGIALLIVLLVREGAGEVGLAIARVGWGLLGLALYHFAQTLSDSIGWLLLIPKENRIRLIRSFFLHWMGESINNLLPTARVGGDIAVARIAAMWGMPLRVASAAIIVDVTIGIVTKVCYLVTACILLIVSTGRTDLTRPALFAVVTGTLAVTGFYAVQRAGIFRWSAVLASRLARSPAWGSLVQSGEALDQAIRLLYSRRGGVAGSALCWISSWIIASGEVWIALRALGLRSSFASAVILETASLTIRGAAFLVPGAVGVQEGGYILLGNLLGISGEMALALSLLRRARELATGIPGLIIWQLVEAGHVWRAR